jgi:hypothetical protein
VCDQPGCLFPQLHRHQPMLGPEAFEFVPVIPVGGGWIKHIVREGARYHVVSWSTLGRQCSDPRCEINRPEPVLPEPVWVEHVTITDVPRADPRPCERCGSVRSLRHLRSSESGEHVLCDSVEACHRRRVEGRRP